MEKGGKIDIKERGREGKIEKRGRIDTVYCIMEIGRVGKMEKVCEIDIKEQVRDEDMYKGGKIQISRK